MSYKEFGWSKWLSIDNQACNAKVVTGIECDKGEIKKFRLQLLALVGNEWKEIRRCDTAHGKIHIHKFYPNRPPRVMTINGVSLREALNEQADEFKQNLEKWLVNYLLGEKKK